MIKIRITTDRLPQPDRHKGAILMVPGDKAASLVAQGFAVIVADAPVEPAKAAVAPTIAPTPEKAAVAAVAAPEVAPRRRRAGIAL